MGKNLFEKFHGSHQLTEKMLCHVFLFCILLHFGKEVKKTNWKQSVNLITK